MSANVRIVMTGHGRGEVYVDGVKVESVRRVEFRAAVGLEANEVVLTLIPEKVSVDGPADVSVVSATPALAEKFSDDYKRWLFLPWWKRMFGPSPFDLVREGPTRSQMKRHGSNGPPPCPPPPPPPNPPTPRDVRKP